jgi:beta-phosphoglucomutase
MQILKNKKAIIFDLDGVLFHSSSAHETAFSQTFAEFELPPINYHEISGMRTDEAFKFCLTRNDTPFTELLISQLTIRKSELAHKILSNHPPIPPNCYSIIQTLAKTHLLTIASSSSSKNVSLFLEASKTKHLFSHVISGEDVNRAKPFPDIFLDSLESLSLSPDQAVIIEDSVNGIVAGRRAKVEVIGFSEDNDSNLIQAGASVVISNLEELIT